MGRLIDADKLLEETRRDRDYARKNGFLDMYYERQVLIDRIKAQPTAYDTEKVVEQLEKLADESYKAYCIAFNSDDRAEYDAYTNAIEIGKHCVVSDEVCEWKDKELYGYYTSCTEFRSCIACKDKYWKYCPYCGKKIKVVE